jgi:hypothetical protein
MAKKVILVRGVVTMKTLVAVLSESPFYFTMSLRDRHGLVKRLASKLQGEQQELDLSDYESKVSEYLKVESD